MSLRYFIYVWLRSIPILPHYKGGVRFLHPLIPAYRSALLAFGLPAVHGRRYTGLPSFALQLTDGLGSVHLPTVLCPCNPHNKKGYPTVYHFGQGSTAS